MNQLGYLCAVILAVTGSCLAEFNETGGGDIKSRNGKALSVFQVVRFPNTVCVGSSSLNGTCYTSSECTNKGGTSAGSCASGFGVCCTFTLGCGSRIAENCTYFQSSTSPGSGACGVTICKCSPDICQLRIDMSTFMIAGPSTLTASNFKVLSGSVSTTTGVPSSMATECLTDTFSVTGSGGTTPPVICGTNNGYHMFVDASDQCNQLNFQLGTGAIGTTLPTSRTWNLKISQISCFDANLAPDSCTQYLWGTTGVINSFNFDNNWQLANQKQTVCIRRERGYCKICYSPTTATDFAISGKTTVGAMGMGCCNYGSAGTLTKAFDCLQIPGAKKTAGTPILNNICGGKFATSTAIAANSMINKTICSSQQPFMVQFQTDAFTLALAIVGKRGFRLAYWQTTTC